LPKTKKNPTKIMLFKKIFQWTRNLKMKSILISIRKRKQSKKFYTKKRNKCTKEEDD